MSNSPSIEELIANRHKIVHEMYDPETGESSGSLVGYAVRTFRNSMVRTAYPTRLECDDMIRHIVLSNVWWFESPGSLANARAQF